MKQLVLNATGCSGRGVRLRELSFSDVISIVEGAVAQHGENAKQHHRTTAGVCMMVAEITAEAGYKGPKDLVGNASVTWKKVTPDHLEGNLEKYFTAPDMAYLTAWYMRVYDAKEADLEKMMGEALDVTAD